jgi:hypothetical protein
VRVTPGGRGIETVVSGLGKKGWFKAGGLSGRSPGTLLVRFVLGTECAAT